MISGIQTAASAIWNEATVFTRIINDQIPAAKVSEDEHTIAFMDAGQVNPGHVIVATKKQVETVVELDDELAAALFRTAARVARAIDHAFKPDGITIFRPTSLPAGKQCRMCICMCCRDTKMTASSSPGRGRIRRWRN